MLNGGEKKRRLYKAMFTDQDTTTFAKILVINGHDVDPFKTHTEYWYVNGASLSLLGQQSLTFEHEDGDDAPSNLPTDWQAFTSPKFGTWTVLKGIAGCGGSLYFSGYAGYDLCFCIVASQQAVTSLVCYDIRLNAALPDLDNVTPDGQFRSIPGPIGGAIGTSTSYAPADPTASTTRYAGG